MSKKNFENFFSEVLDPFELPHRRNFRYLEKNGVMIFFERVFCPEPVVHGIAHKIILAKIYRLIKLYVLVILYIFTVYSD